MNIFKKAIKEVKDLDTALSTFTTPKFRKPTTPPKPNPNYTPPPTVKKPCPYKTPCGWCTKWDKKCDKKIGCETMNDNPQRGLRSRMGVYDDSSKLSYRLIKKIIEDYKDFENAMDNIKGVTKEN